MSWKNTAERYSTASISLHWLMFALIAAGYAFIELRELFPKGSEPRDAMKALHFMFGLSVLLLLIPRLIIRASGVTPHINPESAPWQRTIARWAHLALYMFMLIMPILGWLLLSAAGKPIPFFGLHLPALVNENKDLAEWLKEIHETIGEIGYYLIGLHTMAAMFHHFFQHDNTLTRMLPLLKSKVQLSE